MSGQPWPSPGPFPFYQALGCCPMKHRRWGHSKAVSPGDSLLEGKYFPGSPEGLEGSHSCWAMSSKKQISLVTEKPTPGTPELKLFIALMYASLNSCVIKSTDSNTTPRSIHMDFHTLRQWLNLEL